MIELCKNPGNIFFSPCPSEHFSNISCKSIHPPKVYKESKSELLRGEENITAIVVLLPICSVVVVLWKGEQKRCDLQEKVGGGCNLLDDPVVTRQKSLMKVFV